MGTVAVAGAAATPAQAAEQPNERTGELPLLDGLLASSAAGAAEATQAYVSQTQLQQVRATAQQRAISEALEAAAELRAAQEAEAERRAREAAEAEAAARAAAEEEAAREAAAEAEAAAAPAPAPVTTSASAFASASTPASGGVAAVLDFVRAQLGDAYALGSTGPDAWDCSSLVQAAFSQAGVSLPRVSQDQSTAGTQVSLDALQAGDILYWGGAGSAYHVAVYMGDGTFIGAQNSSTGVVQRDLDWDMPTGAVRVL